MVAPTIAVIGSGAMGAALAQRLVSHGCVVLTDLVHRSSATRQRAAEAGMVDQALDEIVRGGRARWMLSVLPPGEAEAFATKLRQTCSLAWGTGMQDASTKKLVFADCNAVNPGTAMRIAALFRGSAIGFVDGGIIGGPPTPDGSYNPTIYASADPEDASLLDEFETLSTHGLKISALRAEGAKAGDASALKMSYAGITKGMTGLLATMILAADAASPATRMALMHELADSQPLLLRRAVNGLPSMLPKAYRWIHEMDQISEFVGSGLVPAQGEAVSGEGKIHDGVARLYERIQRSLSDVDGTTEVRVLRQFVEEGKKLLDAQQK